MFIRTRTRTRLGYGSLDRRDWSFDGRSPHSGKGKVTTYYQAVESYRENGKPRHRVLASWRDQPTIAGAIARCEALLAQLVGYLDEWRRLIPEGHAGARQPCLIGEKWISRAHNDARIAELERQIAKEERQLLALQQVRDRLEIG